MKTKPKRKRQPPPMIPDSDRIEHYKLREILKEGEWETLGDLRRGFDLQPQRLLYEAFSYPEVFELSPENKGTPKIRLRAGSLESREDILGRRQLVKLVKAAGAPGIYARSLYTSARYPTKLVERLLASVKEIEAATVKRSGSPSILYRWVGEKAPVPESRIQDFDEAVKSPPEAQPEPLAAAPPPALTRAEQRAAEHKKAQAKADAALLAERAFLQAQEDRAVELANVKADPLKEVFSQDELEAMRWKPHSRDAERRRNNPVMAKYRGNAASNANNPNGRYGIRIEGD